MSSRKIIRTLGIVLLTATLLFAGLSAYAWWQRDQLLDALVERINTELERPVEVQKIGLSLRQFPSVSLLMEEVVALDSQGDSLLSARSVYIATSLKNWIRGDYRINGVHVAHGRSHIKEFNGGHWNFQEFIPNRDSDENAGIQLDQLSLRDCYIRYDDQAQKSRSTAYVASADWFPTDPGSSELSSSLLSAHWTREDQEWQLPRTEVVLHLSLPHWSAQILSLGDAFELNFREEDNAIGLRADISEIGQWIAQSPIELQQPLDRLSGSVAIDGTIHLEKGLEDQFSFRSVNASLDHPDWSGIRADVSGRYLSSKKHRSVILDSVFLRKSSSSLQIEGRLDISREQAQIEAKGHLTLADLDGSLPVEWGTNWSGTADVRARFKGKIDRPDWQNELEMELDLADFGFQRGDDLQVRRTKGQVSWRKGQIELDNLLMTLGEQELYADGRIRNWSASSPPELNLRIRTQSLEWTGSEDGGSDFELPEYRGQVTLEADHLRADELVLQAVRADLSLRDQEIGIDQLYAQGIGGELKAKGHFSRTDNGWTMNTDGQLTDVSIDALFKAFSNFGQNTLTSEQLSGRLNANFDLHLPMDADLSTRLAELTVDASTELLEAELSHFQPLYALADHVQLDELSRLRIDRHIQRWSIAKQQVRLEKSLWKSNAIEVEMSGSHDFNNRIDYRFKLPAHRVINKKKRKMDQELSEFLVEVQERKVPSIYLKVTGELSDPQVALDKEALRSGIQQEWKEQKPWQREKDEPASEPPPSGGLKFEWSEGRDSIR